ncbi:dethiobiotin synthase [Mycolicibacterium palauense]|uniref:dethiobiotin synthase n=1 Tax=Mycolicibacterium palauense TaxID=2034511 RepID=UPI000BFEF5AC|nr:dethiobiotin synthase [Mycolicibacterium palauense]
MSVLVVTGTGTGVGKTVATAALACHARLAGMDVAVCKPVQTGTAEGDDDLAETGRLSGVSALFPGARYPDPLAPVAAAEAAGRALPTRAELVDTVRGADAPGRLTLVEGAGGLLVELGEGGCTLRDLAVDLGAAVAIVVAAGLGTLNDTALNLEALASRGLSCAGLIVGSWPRRPGPAEISNRATLPRMAPLRGVLPVGAGALCPAEFEALSAQVFEPGWVTGLVA